MKAFKDSWVPTPVPAPEGHRSDSEGGVEPIRSRASRLALLQILYHVVRIWLRRRSAATLEREARILRAKIEAWGGLWLKLGQILASRTDLLPRQLCDELSRVHDRARPFPSQDARLIIEAELGMPIHEAFDEFLDPPLAAASIGQVHKARLRGQGGWVAVKVQRPEIGRTLDHQMRSIKRLVRFLTFFGILSFFRWNELVAELEQILIEEADYRYEAANLKRMRKCLRPHRIYVPRVFRSHSTRRVLMMELIEGVSIAELIRVMNVDPAACGQWLVMNQIDIRKVGRRLFLSFRRQLFEDNAFHGDLHPGNIVLLRDSRIALLDFGATGTLDREFFTKYRSFARAWANKEFEKAVDYMFLMYSGLPNLDYFDLRKRLANCIKAWDLRSEVRPLPYHARSLTTCMAQLMNIMAQDRCPLEWSFLRVIRAQGTLEAALSNLFPDMDESKLLRVYFKKADRRARQALLSGTALNEYLRSARDLQELPGLHHERLLFQAPVARASGFQYEGRIRKSHRLAASLFSILFFLTGISGGTLFAALLYRLNANVAANPDSWLSGIAGSLPGLPWGIWLLVFLAWVFILGQCLYLYRSFSSRDYRPYLPTRG